MTACMCNGIAWRARIAGQTAQAPGAGWRGQVQLSQFRLCIEAKSALGPGGVGDQAPFLVVANRAQRRAGAFG
jgi:hypothetical protein